MLIEISRAAAFGDLDNDGDIDIVVSNIDGPAHILRNIAGTRGHWIMFRVIHRRGVNAIGARVRITTRGRIQWRTVQRAYSYCSSNDPRVHFGLGAADSVDEVLVRWPAGDVETFGAFQADRIIVLEEGTGRKP